MRSVSTPSNSPERACCSAWRPRPASQSCPSVCSSPLRATWRGRWALRSPWSWPRWA
ncbi:hypothetical protein FIV42_26775 [Persicimonas caeni]|uniref:Mannan-binding protein domain-containing protein n=1 Tax=Persicimonas caeni TaxID=2292766 RepID=A0A4Y6Q0W1_PERCE|nr:hypothetical protein FIV42_26775 [Persicimonas caeni]QED35437.1 hypothetical protein FRD00_26770 [Persicimonas caeni]